MASFFEKLKKGMGLKELIEDLEEEKSPEEEGKEYYPQKPSAKKEVKRPRQKNEKKAEKIEEKTIEEKKPEEKETLEEISKKVEIKEERKEPEEKPAEIKKEKGWFEPEGELAVDIYQTNGEIVLQSAIAGVKPEELDISIENDVLTIKGKREKPFEKEPKNYFYQECYWGYFSRKIILPAEVDSSRTEASMKEGILTIRIPKIEREKKRKIVIKE